jgi:hypothetical protein
MIAIYCAEDFGVYDNVVCYVNIKVKVKFSRYRSEQTLGYPVG